MECRVKPVREGNTELLKDFDDFFEGVVAEIVPTHLYMIHPSNPIFRGWGTATGPAMQKCTQSLLAAIRRRK